MFDLPDKHVRDIKGAMALSIMTLSIMGLFATLRINDTQHNSIECHNAEGHFFIVLVNVVVLTVVIMIVVAPHRYTSLFLPHHQ